MPMTSFSQLIDKAREYLPPEKIALVEEAYNFALKAHEGQVRKSGGPYLEHPVQTALTLAELQLDTGSLVRDDVCSGTCKCFIYR